MKKKNSIDGLTHSFMFMGNEEGCKMVEEMLRKLRAIHHREMYGGSKKIHKVKMRKKIHHIDGKIDTTVHNG